MIPLGKIIGLSAEDYHASECISHSKLEVLRRRPALYKRTYIDKTVTREETRAMVVGQALHCLTLERAHFESRFAVKPDDIDRRTTAGKSFWLAFCERNKGKLILDGEEHAQVVSMRDAIIEHPLAWELLREGEPEVTWRAKANTLPVPLQCRTDWFNENGCELSEGRPYVADVKSVDSLDCEEYRNFERAFVNLGYHRQCGFYLPLLQDCGATCWDFFFIVVEKKEPFGCAVYKPNEDAVSRGMDETLSDLSHLSECYARNLWPNMPTTLQEIGLPLWYTGAA